MIPLDVASRAPQPLNCLLEEEVAIFFFHDQGIYEILEGRRGEINRTR